MSWEKTHKPGECPKPVLTAAFMRNGSIWKCDECGVRWELTRTVISGNSHTRFRKVTA